MEASSNILPISAKDAYRFFRHITKTNNCWEYSGTSGDNKYGRIWIRGVSIGAHRFAYALGHGIDPGELFVCHKCDNPKCVNPDHLFLGTALDNMQDCTRKGRMKGVHPKSRQTQCIHGHDLTGDNLKVREDGRRNCATCARIRSKNAREKAKALKLVS